MGGKWNEQKIKKMNVWTSETVKRQMIIIIIMIHKTSVSY